MLTALEERLDAGDTTARALLTEAAVYNNKHPNPILNNHQLSDKSRDDQRKGSKKTEQNTNSSDKSDDDSVESDSSNTDNEQDEAFNDQSSAGGKERVEETVDLEETLNLNWKTVDNIRNENNQLFHVFFSEII